MKKYSLTDEHRKQLKPWADKWKKIIMSTKKITEDEKDKIVEHVKGLYQAADIAPPPDHRIIFVPSPFVGRFASGFAAGVWRLRSDNKYTEKVFPSKVSPTEDALIKAISISEDTSKREIEITSKKHDKSLEKWYVFNDDVVSLAKRLGDQKFFLECAWLASRFYNGGNFFGQYASYVTFFRYVAKLKIDYSKWDHYEKLSELSGPRYMHKEFCLISEKPTRLLVNDNNEPHSDEGPFCEWEDGSSLYSVNGVRIPAWVVEHPERIKRDHINKEENLEIKRIMTEIYGVSKYLVDVGAKIVDMDSLTLEGSAPRCLMRDDEGNQWLVGTDGSTKRVYHMAVDKHIKTCKQAHKQLCGFNEEALIAES